MNNKEALAAVVSISGVSDSLLSKSLLDASIDGTELYTTVNREGIDKVAIEVLKSMLSVASISEGGFSISYDREAIKGRLTMLASQYGIDTGISPTVRGKNVW